jgi:hypothetical protein
VRGFAPSNPRMGLMAIWCSAPDLRPLARWFKPILSKRAHCRSPADGGVDDGGGMAVEKDELQKLGAVVDALLLGHESCHNELTG